jgi:Tol biopolymer transport system component
VFHRGTDFGEPNEAHDLHIVRREGGDWGAEEEFVATAAWEYSPAFAKDGRVAYVSGVPHSQPYQADIWIRDTSGTTTPLRITPGPEKTPSWNLDGTMLAYSRSSVYMYSLSTGEETALTKKGARMPDWSARRNELIYQYNRSNMDLFRLDMTTSRWRVTNITKRSKALDADGDW